MLDLLTSCICLYNTCIINLDGFDMDWDLKVQRKIQLEANSTFVNIKWTSVFKVVKKKLKQMKRLQKSKYNEWW
jgi:hypothetical protein